MAKGQRGRHADVAANDRLHGDCFVRADGGGAECIEEELVVLRAGGVIATKRRRDVGRHGLGRQPARFTSRLLAADAIGHEEHRRQPLTAQRQAFYVGETCSVHLHLRIHRADEKMILIFGTDLPGMRDAEEV
jgi:hypothetical protein